MLRSLPIALALAVPVAALPQCDEARVRIQSQNEVQSVAISGDRALVGLPGSPQAGRVAVLEHDGMSWNHVDTIVPTPASSTIGSSVAIDGDLGVVSDIHDDHSGNSAGAVYVLEPAGGGGWSSTKIVPPPLDTNAWFGRGVGVDDANERICVGVPRYGSFDYGAVFVYERIGGLWREVAFLQPNIPFASDGFGNALALEEDLLVVGLLGGGSVYVFENLGGTWHQAARLDNPAPNGQGTFGHSVAVDQGRVVVGEPRGGSGLNTGLVHVFEPGQGGWSLAATIPAPISENYQFGSAVDVDGDHILATTPFAPGWQQDQVGRADLFAHNGGSWNRVGRMRAADGEGFDRMGRAGALDGGRVLLSRAKDSHARLHGFENPQDCPGSTLGIGYCTAQTLNSVNLHGVVQGLGSDRVASNLFVLQARDLPPGVPAIALTGLVQQAPATVPGSQGTLCISSPNRLPGVEITSNLGRARFCFDVEGHAVLAGETWNFQAWYRDQNPGPTSNLTEALEVLFQ